MLTSKAILQLFYNIKQYNMFELECMTGKAAREGVALTLWYKMGKTLLIFDVMGMQWEGKHPIKTKVLDTIIRYQISFEAFREIRRELNKEPVYICSGRVRREVVKTN